MVLLFMFSNLQPYFFPTQMILSLILTSIQQLSVYVKACVIHADVED